MAMSYELLLKERDELQREAATANAELFAVLKQSEYRSAEELGLVLSPPLPLLCSFHAPAFNRNVQAHL